MSDSFTIDSMSDQGNKSKSKYPTVLSIHFAVQLRHFLTRVCA
jgi:hypothetical protein